jgi:signal transduction histidine kinase/FixJ family two-component response regulator
VRIAPAASVVACLVLLLSWLSLRAVNPEAELFDRSLTEIDHFAMLENALYRDVFSTRTGTLRNYDPLVRGIDALRDSLVRLRNTSAIDAETTAAVDRLAASIDRQDELVERFKSENALLHNSLSFFVRFGARPASADLNPAISAAAAAMLQFTLDTSSSSAQEVKDRLDQLGQQAATRPDTAMFVEALLAHGHLLHDVLPSVDNTLRALHALPRKLDQDALRTLIMTRQMASRNMAREYRRILYATSLLLVAFLVYLGLQLKSRANALQRRAAFEHVIARISMRFINARPESFDAEIERAVADMAACVGSDRAYFVMSGPGPVQRLHLWCEPGQRPPHDGWPAQAAALATRLGATSTDGVVHVPKVSRMPIGDNKYALSYYGVGGWACVTNTGKDGTVAALGFDAIGRASNITAPGELSLLRMALDTIVHAVTRHSVEKERERLESRLRQARRMERIGTFTSGIAHNFNNLLGGILGHSELMEECLGADTRFTRNVAAIRRGAERARDLVDQMLAFGRRRDAPPRPLNAHSLVTEAAALLHVSLRNGIHLAIHEPRVAAIVSGEPAQLQQVILNLCNNAAQAIDGNGRIDVEMEVHDFATPQRFDHDELQPGRYACIAISDTGHGMNAATLARIFEPFFTTRSSGNGLGLATVYEIVRDHGGGINVRSAPGEGSRFEVWLPCSLALEPIPDMSAPTVPAGGGETILMAAADATLLFREEETVAALGYEPVGFTTADAVLSACRAKPERFDVLVVGPLGSTAASIELATALHAMASHLPIVLATRSADEIRADALVTAGIADVVCWPIVAEEIATALAHGLALRDARRRRRAPALVASSAARLAK